MARLISPVEKETITHEINVTLLKYSSFTTLPAKREKNRRDILEICLEEKEEEHSMIPCKTRILPIFSVKLIEPLSIIFHPILQPNEANLGVNYQLSRKS